MPIYEFYCPDCHRLFDFLSRSVNTSARPACPRCRRPRLHRRPSRFAVSRGREDSADAADGLPEGFDDARLERAMEALAGEAEGIDEHDPRQAAALMRKVYAAAGLPMGPAIREALGRMEAGDDPEAIEASLGDALEAEDPFGGADASGSRVAALARRYLPPSHDDTLYEL